MILRSVALPDRGHGVTVSRSGSLAVAFARHPRAFALAFDPAGHREPVLFNAPDGRHFYGHGAFAHGDSLLFATENDYAAARGVIGVYDVAAAFRRIGEIDIGGVGPHEILAMPDGRTLAVAVGGIETHPDAGDAKLNLATMSPALAFIDAASGDVTASHKLDPALHQLSIRHLAVDGNGAVWFGCQYEGPAGDLPPLIGRATADAAPSMVVAAERDWAALRNYVGSVAASRDGMFVACSSPVAGQIVVLDRAGIIVGRYTLADGCGLAGLPSRSGFIATSGAGDIVELVDALTPVARTDLAFDNHVAFARLP
ncbi:MAG: DUF1513 domain-containing protein [Bauldia sp.]|nr:DUF1513 domain-containing protein [Bauldia sp.]